MGEIYKITCIKNNKVYIGQTTIGYKHRWNQHKSGKETLMISHAIKKHGKINFKIDLIAFTTNNEDLDELEKFYIKKYKSLAPNGYNIKEGGRQFNATQSIKKKVVIVWNNKDFIDKKYESFHDASRKLGFHVGSIRRSCEIGYSMGIINNIKYYARYPSNLKEIKPRKRNKMLNVEQCDDIRFFYNLNIFNQYQLASYYNISQSVIHKIINYTYYGPKKNTKKRLNKKQREEIKNYYSLKKYNKKELITLYNVSRRTINRILS